MKQLKKGQVIKMEDQRTHIISALVLHKPGVLQRVAGLFTRRGFNIESITVGTSEQEEIWLFNLQSSLRGKIGRRESSREPL